jgi:hypothetical protein
MVFRENGYQQCTKVKTYRLDANLLVKLDQLAKRARISENMYVNQVLASASMLEPLSPAFTGITLSGQTFASIISTTNPDSLEIDGVALGKKNYSLARTILESAGYKMTFVQFLIEMLSQEAGWFNVESAPAGLGEQIILHHKYGERWSLFLKSFLSGAYEVVSRERLKIAITHEFVSIQFPTQPATLV